MSISNTIATTNLVAPSSATLSAITKLVAGRKVLAASVYGSHLVLFCAGAEQVVWDHTKQWAQVAS